MRTRLLWTTMVLAGCTAGPTESDREAPASITVDIDRPGHAISPMLFGIFFEDINLSADGGLYAELVRNRSFEDSDKPEHWTASPSGAGRVELAIDAGPSAGAKKRRSLRVAVTGGDGGVANAGYWGMALKKGGEYRLSLIARAAEGFDGALVATLESADGSAVYATVRIENPTTDGRLHSASLTAGATDPNARLAIRATKPGTFWLDWVSLFPKETWKGRENGLRPDLAEMLAAMRPAFVRFPGGCWVEGETMNRAYRWKETIGPVGERATKDNIWEYLATNGIGFHEYLQMCEDLGAEPIFCFNCGMSHKDAVPMEKMGEFVQDALDAIEYANGPVDSRWGARRAQAGHPEPFHLKYVEIGNENGGPAYQERYALFHDAIRAKYPDIRLIGDERVHNRPMDIVDEHYYSSPQFFIEKARLYDGYDREGPKIFVGEYAITEGCGQGNLRAAVGEAAFMTGLERNSDVVEMASYAPLFANVHYKHWNPDLIDFDGSRVYGIPSYYVQRMFSENRGDVTLPAEIRAPSVSQGGAIGVGTWKTQAEFKEIKVTKGNRVLFESDFSKGMEGWRLRSGEWKAQGDALRQTSAAENARAFIGEATWSDYTLTLKARKLGGAEGFLISFRSQDENIRSWWNIGGWGNRRHAVDLNGIVGPAVPGGIETGRWYDIRIEWMGADVKCWLDGRLIHDVRIPETSALYASASYASSPGEVILKVVNVTDEPQETAVALRGARRVGGRASVTVLTSPRPDDENSLDQPTKVSPAERTLSVSGASFRHTFPPHSVTVLRLPAK